MPAETPVMWTVKDRTAVSSLLLKTLTNADAPVAFAGIEVVTVAGL
jgi:hypothetical protein